MFTVNEIIEQLRQTGNPAALQGMSRFGIQTSTAFGVSVPKLRELARKIGRNHELAEQLWKTGTHEARILATMIDSPDEVTPDQMERWAKDFDSWDVVDGSCGNLFDKTPYAIRKAIEWCRRPEEYIKRAGFVLMAELAFHDKKASNETFVRFLPFIIKEASDQRNFVKKAVNWALRQIAKRNTALNKAAVRTAKQIARSDSKAARWVAADALRELQHASSEKTTKHWSKSPKTINEFANKLKSELAYFLIEFH